jgi:hypothetical protein
MDRKAISVRRLADALNVTPKTVYDWRDDRTAISEERIPRLADTLGMQEIEVRRGLGFWVPNGEQAAPARDAAELEEIITDLASVLDRFRRWRRESE